MGLAASQARFLGITARKNSCELRSMQIAQEKLSITNQLSQISEDYQNSLNATKLVWDSEYITDGSIYDLSYSLLMQPSLLNDYSPQLLTNTKNQVVLDNQFANAIKALPTGATKPDGNGGLVAASFADYQTGGIPRTQTNFKNFLQALNNGGILSQANLDKMLVALNGSSSFYDPLNGLGGDVQEKFTTNSMNQATMKNYINKITDPTSNYRNDVEQRFADGQMTPHVHQQILDMADVLSFKGHTVNTKNSSGTGLDTNTNASFSDLINSSTKDNGASANPRFTKEYNNTTLSCSDFNLADLLNKEVTLSSTDSWEMGDALSTFINDIYKVMTQFLAVNENSVDKDYIDYTMSRICELNNMQWDSANKIAKNFVPSKVLSSGEAASKHTSIIQNDGTYSVSLSNVLKGALTYFEKAVKGFDSGYVIQSTDKKLVQNSEYITNDPAYYYFIKNPEALGLDNETALLLNYYSQMFNQICSNGWTENAMVEDPENLKNMLRNGTLFTSVLSETDGMFYQAPYTRNNFIAEVADEDAITRAEAEFKTQQLKLSAKEEELNIDMQMVDAELSALTTEFDTVKSMISKAVEKGFSTLGG